MVCHFLCKVEIAVQRTATTAWACTGVASYRCLEVELRGRVLRYSAIFARVTERCVTFTERELKAQSGFNTLSCSFYEFFNHFDGRATMKPTCHRPRVCDTSARRQRLRSFPVYLSVTGIRRSISLRLHRMRSERLSTPSRGAEETNSCLFVGKRGRALLSFESRKIIGN